MKKYYGYWRIDSKYMIEHSGKAEKVTDNLGNVITLPANIFEMYFENPEEVVTTYCIDAILMDDTIYSVYLVVQDSSPTLEEIKAYAQITNKNYVQSKKSLVSERNLLVSGNACAISGVLKTLNSFQVKYVVEPPYPYDESAI